MRKSIMALTVMAVLMIMNICSAMQIKMLDVGQSEAVLIQTENQNILIDTADAPYREKLLNELERAGVTKIDTLIISHAHADHTANASYLIRHFKVENLYDNGYPSASKHVRNYMRAAAEERVNYKKLQRGDVTELDEGVYFETVYPSAEYEILNVNNQSVVGRLVYKEFTMLFTGDSEAEAETDILANKDEIASAVLKAAHHGSRTSGLYNYLEAVRPEYVVISAGAGNKYGHPHADTVAAYMKLGVEEGKIYCTAFNGTITIETDGEAVTVTPDVEKKWAREYIGDKRTVAVRARRIG